MDEIKSNRKIIKCTNCARQIVSYPANTDRMIGGGLVKHDCCGGCICCECSKDLDENGLYPEERGEDG